ncbi:hypothetical protein [Streptomyces sp. CMSTAAHL-2]|uniref:hypothetical protein n=1 Tax=Streptomyces sp. CMSTAAHL-2 TaxID=2904522 RepID=UPI001E2A9EFF|nr:hypothetical protein [Streptomyces sp. CMSTAAHL-2]MCE3034891.1 hypothetical protein [Streptomyces sp. CMSTAAHL-2]
MAEDVNAAVRGALAAGAHEILAQRVPPSPPSAPPPRGVRGDDGAGPVGVRGDPHRPPAVHHRPHDPARPPRSHGGERRGHPYRRSTAPAVPPVRGADAGSRRR